MEIIFLCLPLCLALYLFTRHLLLRLQNLPPTPFLSFPIIGHLYLLKKPLHRNLAELAGQYGPILFLQLGSRPTVLVSSASMAEECLSRNDTIFANRPRLMAGKYIGYNYTSLAWANYTDHWRNLRRISSLEILSSNRINMLAGIRTKEIRSLVRRLWKSQDQPVDLKTVFFELSMNVMMMMIAGKRYFGGNVEEVEEAASFREIIEDTLRLGDATNIADYLPALRWLGVKGKEKELRELQRKRDRFMQKLIEEHRTRMAKEKESSSSLCNGDDGEKMQKTKTMIEVMLSLQKKEPDYYTDEIIRGLMLALLSAGTDTTSTTLEWAMSLLLSHPHVLKKAQMEMDDCLGHNHLIEESDLSQLPYLQSIIRETERLYPAGPIIPHESSADCVVGGFRIPRGTMLLVNIWAVQNDSPVWKEPRKFKPERFEGLEWEKHGLRLMPFGAGRRGCPGEALAMRMLGLGLGSLLQCFEWEVVGGEVVDMKEGTGLTLPRAQPLLANCSTRPALVNLLSQICAQTLLSAGTDTTSTTLEWAMSLLLSHPDVLKKAQMEMDDCLGHNHLFEESDLSQLPYLQSIIRETQRLYPAGPIITQESSADCVVGGFRVPSGTMLLVNVWAVQDDSRVWKEPRKFRPERFEGLEWEKHGLRLMPFGAGKRGSPGEGLAARMLGLGLGSLLQCFEREVVGGEVVGHGGRDWTHSA